LPSPSWAGCVVPEELLYDVAADVWVRVEGSEVVVGMTDVAQTRCGKIVQVTWKDPGRRVRRGRPLCVIESAKWVGPVLSPLSGLLVVSNEATFEQDPAVANRDPYGLGWLVRLAPSNLEDERPLLVDGPTAFGHYKQLVDAEGIRCFRCEE
jgi:glycine cleavage system H protein